MCRTGVTVVVRGQHRQRVAGHVPRPRHFRPVGERRRHLEQPQRPWSLQASEQLGPGQEGRQQQAELIHRPQRQRVRHIVGQPHRCVYAAHGVGERATPGYDEDGTLARQRNCFGTTAR